MADSKQAYSDAAAAFVNEQVPSDEHAAFLAERSLIRKEKYEINWKKIRVNINEIIGRFTPDVQPTLKNTKMIYENTEYEIRLDLVAGYLRIYNKKTKEYLMPDGQPATDYNMSHFKILHREEM